VKRYIWLTVAMVGGVSLCSAQDLAKTEGMADETGTEIIQEASPWRVSGGLIYKNWLYEHDALQQRAPAGTVHGDDWEQGDTDGSGWGLQTHIGRGDGRLNASFIKSDFKYELRPVGGFHKIDTVARDAELSWSQIRGRSEQAEWGSELGVRYLGMQKSASLSEGQRTIDASGNVNWLMLLGGYNGNWRPFETPMFQAHGSLLFFLGEAKGTALSGRDDSWTDGDISEIPVEEYSLAYGARASFGVDVAMTKRVVLTIDYMREWLYSFDAKDSGIVVFPDNSDALFIENQHSLSASLKYLF
jgi:hypothetical protein